METRQTLTERAFSLARSGTVANVAELRKQLNREGYRAADLQGPTLRRQITALVRANRPLG
jgi:hypothetical protein